MEVTISKQDRQGAGHATVEDNAGAGFGSEKPRKVPKIKRSVGSEQSLSLQTPPPVPAQRRLPTPPRTGTWSEVTAPTAKKGRRSRESGGHSPVREPEFRKLE